MTITTKDYGKYVKLLNHKGNLQTAILRSKLTSKQIIELTVRHLEYKYKYDKDNMSKEEINKLKRRIKERIL
jgi:hypothetical protein